MPTAPATPQFRTALLRRIKNVAPGYDVEFFEHETGLAFRLKDTAGRYRCALIQVRERERALDRSHIKALLKQAGFPGISPG